MTQYQLTSQHYDMQAGTIVFGVGEAVPQPGDAGDAMLVTENEADISPGALRIIPVSKLQQI
jgi:hypothetical protein